MSDRLHILLPVHNRRETTVAFVEALRRQTWRRFRLVLIDDGSTDGTADAVREVWHEVDVVTGSGDWWWAGALEQGCRRVAATGVADDDALLMINDDVLIAADFLERGMAELAESPGTLLLARQFDAKTGAEIDGGGGVHADLQRLRFRAARTAEEINCMPTRGLFMRWRDWRRIGGFRPKQLPHYLSDYEFTIRAGSAGLQLRLAHAARVGVQIGLTGRSLENVFQERVRDRFRLLLSPRFKDNPRTWSAFVTLAVPRGRRPYLWVKVWLHFLVVMVRCLIVPRYASGSNSKFRRLRSAVGKWLPAECRRRIRCLWEWRWFRGDYATWADACAASGGYADRAIVERVLAATLDVRAGRAAFERDGVLFSEPEPDAPLLRALLDVRQACGGKLRVLDFGGSLGSSYWRHRSELATSAELIWDVVEQPAFVEAGRQHLAGAPLRFFHDVREAERADRHDVLLASGVIQYLEEAARVLSEWRELRVPFLLLNNLPLHRRGPDRLRVQHVPPSIYPATYPVRFFNRGRFLGLLEPHYEIVSEFASEAVWPVGFKRYPSTGLLLRRKGVA